MDKSETKPRYMIFVASTKPDLEQHREYVKQSISTHEHVPKGMEDFHASDSKPIDVCLREIDQCDAFVCIVGCRYGNLVPDQSISFTEAEFNHACTRQIRKYIYIASDKHEFSKSLSQYEALSEDQNIRENPIRLKTFISRLLKEYTPVSFDSAEDLRSKFLSDIGNIEEEIGLTKGEPYSFKSDIVLDIMGAKDSGAIIAHESAIAYDLTSPDKITFRPSRHLNRFVIAEGEWDLKRNDSKTDAEMCLCDHLTSIIVCPVDSHFAVPDFAEYEAWQRLSINTIICADGTVADALENMLEDSMYSMIVARLVMQYVNYDVLYEDLERCGKYQLVSRKYYFKVVEICT